jgi:hypothetical protein
LYATTVLHAGVHISRLQISLLVENIFFIQIVSHHHQLPKFLGEKILDDGGEPVVDLPRTFELVSKIMTIVTSPSHIDRAGYVLVTAVLKKVLV